MLLKMKFLKKLILVLILVTRTKFSTNTNALDDKIDKVEKKIPDISSLETKRNVTALVNNLNNKIDNLKINDYAK